MLATTRAASGSKASNCCASFVKSDGGCGLNGKRGICIRLVQRKQGPVNSSIGSRLSGTANTSSASSCCSTTLPGGDGDGEEVTGDADDAIQFGAQPRVVELERVNGKTRIR